VIQGAIPEIVAEAPAKNVWKHFATGWMWQYNHERPNMGLGGVTPKQRLMAEA